MAEEHFLIDLALLSRYNDNINNKNAPQNFSVLTSDWRTLDISFAGCGYKAEIVASGVTAADYPDIYFDETSIAPATSAEIIAATDTDKVILYAKNIPISTLSGAFFIRKGAAV